MTAWDPKAFLDELAPQILAELKPPTNLKKFTRNSAIVGDYVEAGVRRLVRRYLVPIRVSKGAVIDQGQEPGSKTIPQLDTVAWIPGPVSAVFEIDDFAIVPRSSCLGILEIKSSAYPHAVTSLEERTDPTFAGPLTASIDDTGGYEGNLNGYVGSGGCFAMGVVSILLKNQAGNPNILKLREDGRIVVLFEEGEEEDTFVPHNQDIYRLIHFLGLLRLRAALRDGRVGINMPLLKPGRLI